MTNYLMTQMLTTPLYTYRPEERMQMQRMDDISSPAVRIHYTERPHVFTLRLSWTRRHVSAPAPEERRAADRVPEEAEAREPGGHEEGRHLHPLRAVQKEELRHPRRPLHEDH